MRDTSYLYYIFYIASFGLYQLSVNGAAVQYFWMLLNGFIGGGVQGRLRRSRGASAAVAGVELGVGRFLLEAFEFGGEALHQQVHAGVAAHGQELPLAHQHQGAPG